MTFVIVFVSLMMIVGIYSQRFCMSLSLTLGNFSEFNGQFVYKGGRNDGKKYYEIDNREQTQCVNPGYLYWNSNPANNWFIGSEFLKYKYICTDIINESDPSTCTNWNDSNIPPGAVGVILEHGNCPYDAMCDTITLSPNAGNCSGTFNYIAPNRFGDGNGWYLIYQEKMEKWVCWKNIINVVGCPLFGVPSSWIQANPSGMKRPFQNGDVQTYDGISAGIPNTVQFTCNGHNTVDPSPAPSSSPTLPSNPPSKSPSDHPTFNPSKAPSNNPTFGPSKAPSNNPTMNPSKAPSITTSNPTQIPTDTPSMTTLNPSINPTNNPTAGPTKNPTIAPTEPTGYPSSNPSKSPLIPTSFPTINPSQPSDSPTNVPTEPSMEPTADPTTMVTIGEVHEDPVGNFKYYWDNYRFYMVGGGIVLVILLCLCCYCCAKPSVKRRERYRYNRNAMPNAFTSRKGGHSAVPMQSVSYGGRSTGFHQ